MRASHERPPSHCPAPFRSLLDPATARGKKKKKKLKPTSSSRSTASVAFPTPATAAIAAAALGVDPELRPESVSKAVWAEGKEVRFRFAAADPRLLRAAACTFCDLGGVAARAVEAFPPLDKSKK